MVYGINVNIDDAFGQSIRTPRCVCVFVSNRPWMALAYCIWVFECICRNSQAKWSSCVGWHREFSQTHFPQSSKILQIPPQEVFGPSRGVRGSKHRSSKGIWKTRVYTYKRWSIPLPSHYPSPILLGLHFGRVSKDLLFPFLFTSCWYPILFLFICYSLPIYS